MKKIIFEYIEILEKFSYLGIDSIGFEYARMFCYNNGLLHLPLLAFYQGAVPIHKNYCLDSTSYMIKRGGFNFREVSCPTLYYELNIKTLATREGF